MDKKKGKIGFTAGNFDLLHPGYIYTFEAAKENCDHFIVFLQRYQRVRSVPSESVVELDIFQTS